MSMHTTFKTYKELTEYLLTVDHPQCFTVNYLPDTKEYALWIGNQPYYVYEKWIEEEEQKVKDLKKEINKWKLSDYRREQETNNYKFELNQIKEAYKDRESDIDFYWTTLLQIGKIARDYDNKNIYEIVKSIISPNEFD